MMQPVADGTFLNQVEVIGFAIASRQLRPGVFAEEV